MQITIVQGAFLPVPPLRGGAMEKLWFELGRQFSQQGHSVCHVSRRFPGLPTHEVIEGVRHLRVKGYDIPGNLLHLKALDFLYSLRALRSLPTADILITNTFWIPILAGRIQNRVGKIIVDVNRLPKGQMRFYGRAAGLRAPSSAVHQSIVRQAPFLQGRVRIIPNSLSFLLPLATNKEHSSIILYCGRLHPEKGIELLIQAFSQACARGLSCWTLRLVGPADTSAGGGGNAWIQGLLAGPQAKGLRIEWLGPIYDEQELMRHYQRAAIFVYPSLAESGETFGLAPLEAMACGAVPIVSALACFRDFITPGVNGLVFNHRAADAPALLATQILELTINHEQRFAMAQAALAVRQSHHAATIAADFLHWFEGLTQQRSNA